MIYDNHYISMELPITIIPINMAIVVALAMLF